MSKFTGLVAVAFLAMVASGHALADAKEGQLYLSAMGSYVDDDTDRGIKDEINGGQISLGYALSDAWNIEAMISIANNNTDSVRSRIPR